MRFFQLLNKPGTLTLLLFLAIFPGLKCQHPLANMGQNLWNSVELGVKNLVNTFVNTDSGRTPVEQRPERVGDIQLPAAVSNAFGTQSFNTIGCPKCMPIHLDQLPGPWHQVYGNDNFIKTTLIALASAAQSSNSQSSNGFSDSLRALIYASRMPVCVRFDIGDPVSYGFMVDYPLLISYSLGVPRGPPVQILGRLRQASKDELVLMIGTGEQQYRLKLCMVDTNLNKDAAEESGRTETRTDGNGFPRPDLKPDNLPNSFGLNHTVRRPRQAYPRYETNRNSGVYQPTQYVLSNGNGNVEKPFKYEDVLAEPRNDQNRKTLYGSETIETGSRNGNVNVHNPFKYEHVLGTGENNENGEKLFELEALRGQNGNLNVQQPRENKFVLSGTQNDGTVQKPFHYEDLFATGPNRGNRNVPQDNSNVHSVINGEQNGNRNVPNPYEYEDVFAVGQNSENEKYYEGGITGTGQNGNAEYPVITGRRQFSSNGGSGNPNEGNYQPQEYKAILVNEPRNQNEQIPQEYEAVLVEESNSNRNGGTSLGADLTGQIPFRPDPNFKPLPPEVGILTDKGITDVVESENRESFGQSDGNRRNVFEEKLENGSVLFTESETTPTNTVVATSVVSENSTDESFSEAETKSTSFQTDPEENPKSTSTQTNFEEKPLEPSLNDTLTQDKSTQTENESTLTDEKSTLTLTEDKLTQTENKSTLTNRKSTLTAEKSTQTQEKPNTNPLTTTPPPDTIPPTLLAEDASPLPSEELIPVFPDTKPGPAAFSGRAKYIILTTTEGFPGCQNYFVLTNNRVDFFQRLDADVLRKLQELRADSNVNPLQYTGCPIGFEET